MHDVRSDDPAEHRDDQPGGQCMLHEAQGEGFGQPPHAGLPCRRRAGGKGGGDPGGVREQELRITALGQRRPVQRDD